MRQVAALFIETAGCYANCEAVELWSATTFNDRYEIQRDARAYAGPHPVIAHPPCERWGRFWHGSTRKPHQFQMGDDGGCFAHALSCVQVYGGVLEHPADSHAWRWFGLRPPVRGHAGWQDAGHGCITCYVDQGNYGHDARKPTWLLASKIEPLKMIWGEGAQQLPQWMIDRYGYAKARRIGVTAMKGGKLKKRNRQATPPVFRDALLQLARSVI